MSPTLIQMNRNKTVGGVAHTKYMYILLGGRKDRGQKAENYVPSLSFKNGGGGGN